MTLKDSRSDHGTTKTDPNSPEQKRRVSNRARTYAEAGGPQEALRVTDAALRKERRAPKEVTPSITAQVDNDEVLRGCPEGRDLRIPTSAKGEPRSLEEWKTRHTHTHIDYRTLNVRRLINRGLGKLLTETKQTCMPL